MAKVFNTLQSLHESIKTLEINAVRRALQYNPKSLNELDCTTGWSALYQSVVYGQIEISRYLLKEGANPNLTTKVGETPLHYAVEANNIELVDVLLQNKADPNLKQIDGNTAFHLACKRNNTMIIKRLLDYNVDVNAQNKLGLTPLHFVSYNKNSEIYEILLNKKADTNIKDNKGNKPIALDFSKKEKKFKADTKKVNEEQQESSILKEIYRLKQKQKENKENFENIKKMQNFQTRLTLMKTKLGKAKEESSNSLFVDINGSNSTTRCPEKVLDDITNIGPERPTSVIREINIKDLLLKTQNQVNNERYDSTQIRYQNCEPKRKTKFVTLAISSLNPQTVDDSEEKNLEKSAIENLSNSSINSIKLSFERKSYQNGEGEQNVVDIQKYDRPVESRENILEKANMIGPEIVGSEVKFETQKKSPTCNQENCLISGNIVNKIPKEEEKESLEETVHKSHKLSDCSIDKPEVEMRERINPKATAFNFQERIKNDIKMTDWLEELALWDLKSNFTDNGYVYQSKFRIDYQKSKVIFENLISRFGVDKLGYRCRIVMRLREDNGLFKREGLFKNEKAKRSLVIIYPKVEDWLCSLGYRDYVDHFLENGFDNFEYLVLQTFFKELPFDEFLMRDDLGIDNEMIIDDILRRLRSIYNLGSMMELNEINLRKFLDVIDKHI